MIFRFNNPPPIGKFQFTCFKCGKWNNVFIEPVFMGKERLFPCDGDSCNVVVKIWFQDTHWHMELIMDKT